jgi:hypothetical protein
MPQFEYKVIPAPRRGEKVKGAKTTEDRFAAALMRVMNELGADGWEYLRADTLPCDERSGLTGTKTSFQNMLVFRRGLAAGAGQGQGHPLGDQPARPALLAVPAEEAPPRPVGAAAAPAGQAPAVGAARDLPSA